MPFEEATAAGREAVSTVKISDKDLNRAWQDGYALREEFVERLANLQAYYAERFPVEEQAQLLAALEQAETAFQECVGEYELSLEQILLERSADGYVPQSLVKTAFSLQQQLDEQFLALRNRAVQEFGIDTRASAETAEISQLEAETSGVTIAPGYFGKLAQWGATAEQLEANLRAVGRDEEAVAIANAGHTIATTLQRFDGHTVPEEDEITISRAAYPADEQRAVEKAVQLLQAAYERLQAEAEISLSYEQSAELEPATGTAAAAPEDATAAPAPEVAEESKAVDGPEAVDAEDGWTDADIDRFEQVDHHPFLTPAERSRISALVAEIQEQRAAGVEPLEQHVEEVRASVDRILTTPELAVLPERLANLQSITAPLQTQDPDTAAVLREHDAAIARSIEVAGVSWEAVDEWSPQLVQDVRHRYEQMERAAFAAEADWLQVAGRPVPRAGSPWAEVVAFRREIGLTVHDPTRHPELQAHGAVLQRIFAVLRHYENRGRPLSAAAAEDLRDLAYQLYVDDPLLEWVEQPEASVPTVDADVQPITINVDRVRRHPSTEAAATAAASAANAAAGQRLTPPASARPKAQSAWTRLRRELRAQGAALRTTEPRSPRTQVDTTARPTEPLTAAASQTKAAEQSVTSELPRELTSALRAVERRVYEQTVGFGYREDFPVGNTLNFIRQRTVGQLRELAALPIRELRAQVEPHGVRAETLRAWCSEIDEMERALSASSPASMPMDRLFYQWYQAAARAY